MCLDKLFTKFWTVEEVLTSITLTAEDELAEEIFVSTTRLLGNGTFQANLPLSSSQEKDKLGDFFHIALKRLILQKRFIKNSSFFEEYKEFIHEYVALSYRRFIPLSLENEILEKNIFSLHILVREGKSSTNFPVVFDGSSKTFSGVSLKDKMMKDYQVQPNLFDNLCRSRSNLSVERLS